MSAHQRFVTCPDCGDPNVPWDAQAQYGACEVCLAACSAIRAQNQKKRQMRDDPNIPALVERNIMSALHIRHAQNIRSATRRRTCVTCAQLSGDDSRCIYCRYRRHNPNIPDREPPGPIETFNQDEFSELPKKARLFDISGIADRELACVICMEDIPPEVERVYYCDCQALICALCETNPEVKRLEKCPNCRKDYQICINNK